jgi:hypothetical protein
MGGKAPGPLSGSKPRKPPSEGSTATRSCIAIPPRLLVPSSNASIGIVEISIKTLLVMRPSGNKTQSTKENRIKDSNSQIKLSHYSLEYPFYVVR